MIDKRIFYCWFGKGKKKQLNLDCIESWKKFCPDYEIIEINETNFDYEQDEYAAEGYRIHNWSAVSNAARLHILNKENGFYLDTDIQLLKSLDELRECDGGFISEYTAGQPDAGILGRGNNCPELYRIAKQELVKGAHMHRIMLRNVYKLYDIYGQRKECFKDNFTFLGEEYIPSLQSRFTNENTIAIHHYEGNARIHKMKITDKFPLFPRVNVYADNHCLFRDKTSTVNLYLDNKDTQWYSSDVLGRLNYFFNPKVVKIQCKGFGATRIDYDTSEKTEKVVTATGMIVEHIV